MKDNLHPYVSDLLEEEHLIDIHPAPLVDHILNNDLSFDFVYHNLN